MRIKHLAAAAAVTTSALAVGSAPAQAYEPDPTALIGYVTTPSCAATGDLDVDSITSTHCVLYDNWDDTYFRRDDNGRALKVELRKGSSLVGKVEFHPRGDELWIYDTSDDGDTIWVTVCVLKDTGPCRDRQGPWRGPVNGYNVVYLGQPEGANLRFTIWDNNTPEPNDPIVSANAVA